MKNIATNMTREDGEKANIPMGCKISKNDDSGIT